MIPTEQSNLYQRLGVNQDANSGEIRKAYLQMAKKWHPDASSFQDSHIQFLAVSEAFETLSDTERRREYDNILRILTKANENTGFDFQDYAPQHNLNRNFKKERRRKTNSSKTFEKILRENFF